VNLLSENYNPRMYYLTGHIQANLKTVIFLLTLHAGIENLPIVLPGTEQILI